MKFIVFFLLLVIFLLATYIFDKKDNSGVLEVKRGKFYNIIFLSLFLLMGINMTISILDINDIINVSCDVKTSFDVFINIVLLIYMVFSYYYALLEHYNKVRVFIWPFFIYILFIYVSMSFLVDVSLGGWLGFNKYVVGSFNVFSWCYLILSFMYFFSVFIVPFVCYRKRKFKTRIKEKS